MKKTITLEYELDNMDLAILDVIDGWWLTVHQIRAIIRHQTKEDISPRLISEKLNELSILGLVQKEKKNSKVYHYKRFI